MSYVSSPAPSGTSPGFIDRAETFAESEVTVETTGAKVFPGTEDVALRNYDKTINLGLGSDYGSGSGELGTYFTVNESGVVAIRVTIECPDFNGEVYLDNITDGTNGLDSATGVTNGGEATLAHNFTSGKEYRVRGIDSDGTFLNPIRSSEELGYTEEGITFNDSWLGSRNNVAPAIGISEVDVVGEPTTGTATVKWPHPPDVYGWDSATFQANADGETLAVYLEQSSDGGSTWTEVAGPLQRGDDIPADPANEVRYRVDFSRGDTSNAPRLEAAYRRYTV